MLTSNTPLLAYVILEEKVSDLYFHSAAFLFDQATLFPSKHVEMLGLMQKSELCGRYFGDRQPCRVQSLSYRRTPFCNKQSTGIFFPLEKT